MKAKTKAKLAGIVVLLAVVAFFANPNCDIDYYNVKVTDKQVKMINGKDVYHSLHGRRQGQAARVPRRGHEDV
jgi:hypothetical protein